MNSDHHKYIKTYLQRDKLTCLDCEGMSQEAATKDTAPSKKVLSLVVFRITVIQGAVRECMLQAMTWKLDLDLHCSS